MDIEFHYYIVGILAEKAGLDRETVDTIAYSSQFVDDNCIIFEIKSKDDSEYSYSNYISQTMNILNPKNSLMRIYPCFHFLPGNYAAKTARRGDGKMHLINCTPDSQVAKKVMKQAVKSGDPYRIGIAVHSYADTWAHQNFVGYFDHFNGMGGVWEQVSPNVGHADAGHNPDIPGLCWKDSRLAGNGVANNKKRFLSAAKAIFKVFCKMADAGIKTAEIAERWKVVVEELDSAIGPEFKGKDMNSKLRIKQYQEIAPDLPEYDPETWFSDAVEVDVVGLPDKWHHYVLNKLHAFDDHYYKKTGFEQSHWYRFQVAVKEHQETVAKICAPIFAQLEIDTEKW